MLDSEIEIKRIGEAIKKLRIEKGFTSAEAFSNDNNLARVQYWRIESGNTNFTMKTLIEVLNIHQISLVDFFKMLA